MLTLILITDLKDFVTQDHATRVTKPKRYKMINFDIV